MLQQTHTYANTGLQSFADASPDYDIAPVGLGSMQQQAQKLAEYGRNGDIYVVHAAEGETVVPMEVLNANPKVKELLFNQMKEMGLDPQEFVIGNDLNSINPVTGMPEFFFKSIFRGVKKAVKKVIKVAKKIAPIALPLIAMTFGFPFLGTAFKAGTFGASALAGGLGTLAQGGSVKDALKAGLISGGIASLSGGLKGLGTEGGTFMGGIESSFTGAGAPSVATQMDRLKTGDFGDFIKASPDAAMPGAGPAAPTTSYGQLDPGATFDTFDPRNSRTWYNPGNQTDLASMVKRGEATQTAGLRDYTPFAEPKFTVGKEMLTGTSAEAAARKKAMDEAVLLLKPGLRGTEAGAKFAIEAGNKAVAALKPSMLKTWGPAAGLGLGAAYLGGAFDTEVPPGVSPEEWEEMKRKARNPYWYPTQKEGESDADFAERSRKLRAPYELSEEGLQIGRGVDLYGHQNFRSGGYVQGYNTGGSVPDWATGLPRGLRYIDGRVEIDPTYSSARPTSGKTYGWETYFDNDDEQQYSFDPQAYFWNLYNTDNVRDLGGGFSLGQNSGYDDAGDDYSFFEIQGSGSGGGNGGGGNGGGGNGGGGNGGGGGTTGGPTAPGGPIISGEHVSPIWNPLREDRETDSAYGARVTDLREPYLFSDDATQVGRGMFAADGGLAQYPRREMLVEGPGTERSDDIPAMLSDGEFVLNSKSVRGADPTGQGNRYRGAQNLYKMMRNFEMRA